jgi:selenide,water dikinase
VLVGFDLADDAGVVRTPDGRCLIQTVDFFTPVVDDAYTFGAIAATNALSDVYAMGGVPLACLNIVAWPHRDLPPELLGEILRGGGDKVLEAGAVVVGGHSVTNNELLFGMSVTGTVDCDKIWANAGARVGDVLVLTKPLGTGVLSTAIKRDMCPEPAIAAATAAMLELNMAAADAARPLDVHGCTDITGFGLVGHAWEMARASDVAVHLRAGDVPLLPFALEAAAAGHLTRGETKNRSYVGDALHWDGVGDALQSVLVDPQTSGGLLFALSAADAAILVEAGVGVVIGDCRDGDAGVWVTG